MGGFKRMLFICSNPPSGVGGAPVIFRQLLRGYDPESLEIVCDAQWYRQWALKAGATLLPSRHTLIPNLRFAQLRPARVFEPLFASLNALRFFWIRHVCRRIVRENGIEAIFTATTACEFNLAALAMHREFDLPLYYFETDDWEIANSKLLPRWLVRKYRLPMFRSAEKLWLISPAMVRDYRERFGVQGDFLFHFVDPVPYSSASHSVVPPKSPHPIEIVYTGSVNLMFLSTMRELCRHINEGLEVAGRRVRLTVYGPACPTELIGPAVSWGGLVSPDSIPQVLAKAHVLLIAITFDQDPDLLQLVKTNIYTKTLDYLASGRPVLVVSPPYTSQVEYFAGVTHVLTSLQRSEFAEALSKLVLDGEYVETLLSSAEDLVTRLHGPEALETQFLRHFRRATPEE